MSSYSIHQYDTRVGRPFWVTAEISSSNALFLLTSLLRISLNNPAGRGTAIEGRVLTHGSHMETIMVDGGLQVQTFAIHEKISLFFRHVEDYMWAYRTRHFESMRGAMLIGGVLSRLCSRPLARVYEYCIPKLVLARLYAELDRIRHGLTVKRECSGFICNC